MISTTGEGEAKFLLIGEVMASARSRKNRVEQKEHFQEDVIRVLSSGGKRKIAHHGDRWRKVPPAGRAPHVSV